MMEVRARILLQVGVSDFSSVIQHHLVAIIEMYFTTSLSVTTHQGSSGGGLIRALQEPSHLLQDQLNWSTDRKASELFSSLNKRDEHRWGLKVLLGSRIKNKQNKGKIKVELGMSKARGRKKKSAQVVWRGTEFGEEDELFRRRVTGSDSTEACCPLGRRWLVERWCRLHCYPETRRAQICLLSVSVTQCGKFLQMRKRKEEHKKTQSET